MARGLRRVSQGRPINRAVPSGRRRTRGRVRLQPHTDGSRRCSPTPRKRDRPTGTALKGQGRLATATLCGLAPKEGRPFYVGIEALQLLLRKGPA